MKRLSTRCIALLLSVLMVISMTSCSLFGKVSDRDDNGRSEQDDDDDDEDDETRATRGSFDTSVQTVPTQTRPSDSDLTYPDKKGTPLSQIHPVRTPGNVTGTEAAKVVKEVEDEMIKNGVESYVDIAILFEHPENYGLSTDEVTWGKINTDNTEAIALNNKMLDKLLTVDPDSLSKDDRICYDKMLWDIEENVYALQYSAFNYYESIFNPLTGPQCEILFILDVIPVSTKEEAENYILLVKDVDRYFDEICKFEEDRVKYGFASGDDTYRQIAESFDNLVKVKDTCFLYDSFAKKLDKVAGLSDADKQDLIRRHDDAMKNSMFPEFEECAQRMRALMGSGGRGTGLTEFAGSQEYYSYLCRKLSNSNKSVIELRKNLDDTIDSVVTAMIGIMGDPSYNRSSYVTHSYSKGGLEDNLNFLKEQVKADFPDLHDHSYQVINVPKELQDNFSPAAYLGYHLDNYNSNQIIVNEKDSGRDFGVTCSHEGYPGHMFQSVYTRSKTSHPYMYIFDSIGYAEGWATYVENYSMKYFDSDEKVRTIVKIYDEMNILIMARCDIGIHTQGWSAQDCADYFTKAYFGRLMPNYKASAADLKELYDLLVSDPGYAVKYGCGFVNTGLVMQAAHDQFPNATDKEIHTAYLNAMPGTFEQIKKNMFDELKG